MVTLMDKDRKFNKIFLIIIWKKILALLWETDDLMGTGYTDQYGNYTVEGICYYLKD